MWIKDNDPPAVPLCAYCRGRSEIIVDNEDGSMTNLCYPCLPDYDREKAQPEYELNEYEQGRLQEELDLLEARRSGETTVTTSALVVKGNSMRWKTPRERARESGNRHGMPRELIAALEADPFGAIGER